MFSHCVFFFINIFNTNRQVYEKELNKDVEKADKGASEEKMKEHKEAEKFIFNKLSNCSTFYCFFQFVLEVTFWIF